MEVMTDDSDLRFSWGFAQAVLMPRATGELMQLDRYGPGTQFGYGLT